jgi:hypothetical protein
MPSEFTPFDDSQQVIYIPTDEDTGGISTLEIDPFRQGVEIKTNKQRFISTQPKIWAGSLEHTVEVNAIGQARSFTEFENSPIWSDLPEFDPVSYIELGEDYPLPIVFNEGPQQEEETSLEPITIPFRKNTNEGPFFAHRVAGQLEDGNNFDTIFRNSNQTSQFWDYDSPREQRLFLDEGQQVWGALSNGINTEGYSYGQERLLRAFDDTTIDDIPQSTDASSDLLGVLYGTKMNLDQDFRPSRTRSAGANTFVYGRDSAIYGTESFAFIGLTRGT